MVLSNSTSSRLKDKINQTKIYNKTKTLKTYQIKISTKTKILTKNKHLQNLFLIKIPQIPLNMNNLKFHQSFKYLFILSKTISNKKVKKSDYFFLIFTV